MKMIQQTVSLISRQPCITTSFLEQWALDRSQIIRMWWRSWELLWTRQRLFCTEYSLTWIYARRGYLKYRIWVEGPFPHQDHPFVLTSWNLLVREGVKNIQRGGYLKIAAEAREALTSPLKFGQSICTPLKKVIMLQTPPKNTTQILDPPWNFLKIWLTPPKKWWFLAQLSKPQPSHNSTTT